MSSADSSVVRDGLIHIAPTSASMAQDGSGSAESYDRDLLLNALNAPTGQKSLPTTLLYDERGLELYDDITTHAGEHYYLFPAEEHILKTHAADVVRVMCAGDREGGLGASDASAASPESSVILELGAGYVPVFHSPVCSYEREPCAERGVLGHIFLLSSFPILDP